MATRLELRAISQFSKDINYYHAVSKQEIVLALNPAKIGVMNGIDPLRGDLFLSSPNGGTTTGKNIGSNSSTPQGATVPSLISGYADSRPTV